MKRAILYARVSTDEQAENGYGLPSQLDAMRQYAERNGFEIVKEFQEDYTGRIALAERPEGKKLTALLADSKQVDAVIAARVDRIARDSFFARLAVRDWLKRGLDVHTCDVGRIDDDNGIVFTILNWQGNADWSKIIVNTMNGRNAKARGGEVVGAPRPPYGYHFVKNADGKTIGFEIYEPEARIVKIVYTWYVEGDETGARLSLFAIAARLSQIGMPSPRQNIRRVYAPTIWSARTVGRILANETYSGTWHYRKVDKRGGKERYRDTSEQIAVNVPAIVDREIWERAQAQRGHNAEMSKRNCKHDYLLRGRVRCGVCGRAVVGGHCHVGGKDYFYYICGVKSRQIPGAWCNQKRVRCERLDSIVWESVKELFSDLDRLWEELKSAQQKELDMQNPKRDELKAVEEFIAQADQEADEIAATMRIAKGRVGERVQKQQDELNARLEGYHKRRGELITELGARRLTDDAIQDVLKYARDVQAGINEANFEIKRKVIDLLDVRVVVHDDQAQISCAIATPTTRYRTGCNTRRRLFSLPAFPRPSPGATP